MGDSIELFVELLFSKYKKEQNTCFLIRKYLLLNNNNN